MKEYLVKSKKEAIEFNDFVKLEKYMNELAKTGISEVTVKMYENHFLRCEIKYIWNSVSWEMIDKKIKTMRKNAY